MWDGVVVVVKFAFVIKKAITVQWAKAEMSHHEGKVGTHALFTQLLYIIYESARASAQKWALKQ